MDASKKFFSLQNGFGKTRVRWQRARYNFRHHSFGDFLTRYFFAGINKLIYFDILKVHVLKLENVDPSCLNRNDSSKVTSLSEEQCLYFAKNLENELTRSFVKDALAKGDTCFAVLDNDRLSAYCWFSNKPTRISDDLEIHFDNSFIYSYKALVLPQYRGRRLNPFVAARAVKAFTEFGYKGTIGYVSSFNFSAMRSYHRVGNKTFGKLYIVGLFGKYVIRHTAGCKKHDLRVKVRNRVGESSAVNSH